MLNGAQMETDRSDSEDRQEKFVYTPPEVFQFGLANNLIQGPSIHEYWDCVGNGKTYTRPDC